MPRFPDVAIFMLTIGQTEPIAIFLKCCYICINRLKLGLHQQCSTMHYGMDICVDDLCLYAIIRLVVSMSKKHMANWGTVDRFGHWKRTICDADEPYQTIWSILKPQFRQMLVLTSHSATLYLAFAIYFCANRQCQTQTFALYMCGGYIIMEVLLYQDRQQLGTWHYRYQFAKISIFSDSMASPKIKHTDLCALLRIVQYGAVCPKII